MSELERIEQPIKSPEGAPAIEGGSFEPSEQNVGGSPNLVIPRPVVEEKVDVVPPKPSPIAISRGFLIPEGVDPSELPTSIEATLRKASNERPLH